MEKILHKWPLVAAFAFLTACGKNENPPSGHQTVIEDETISISEKMQIEPMLAKHAYVPFPAGYGYMQDITALQDATNVGNTQVIREHAWRLWAGVMQPVEGLNWPLWFTWPNTKGAFEVTDQQKMAEKAVIDRLVKTGESIRAKNKKNMQSSHAPAVDTPAPTYNIPLEVVHRYPQAVCNGGGGLLTLCDGTHFVNNGDIMIATESLSQEAMDDIRTNKLYLKSTLDKAHAEQQHMMSVSERFIVTKHMYWPVKAQGITAIPVWKDNFPDGFTGYAGYENWNTLVALNPSNPQSVGTEVEAEFLYGVRDHCGQNSLPSVKQKAMVHALDEFYFHKVTQADWDSFDDADKAIITAASLWANNKLFEVGDYLVTVAMHVNTKELPSWTLQSVWWSDTPDQGIYAENRPQMPQAKGPWNHYLLTDAYAVPAVDGKVKKAVNPYIEGVIHPIATSCRNCHVRAGWPTDMASYQNPDCPGLLDDLTPSSACLKGITLTDYLWIIPDRAK